MKINRGDAPQGRFSRQRGLYGPCRDVEAVGEDYSLVADAKVFRLSRTAKNQKDFKIDAMHRWKHGKLYAMVVCPIYQLPARTSQIYQQAIIRSVCVFTYSHLAVLLQFSSQLGERSAQGLLLAALRCSEGLNPTKDWVAYWTCLNRSMLGFNEAVVPLWRIGKIAMVDGLKIVKEEAPRHLARQREQIMKMSRAQAIAHLIKDKKIDGREKRIQTLADNGILSMA